MAISLIEHPVGVPFELDGVRLVTVEGPALIDDCYDCAGRELCGKLTCYSSHRRDGKTVHYETKGRQFKPLVWEQLPGYIWLAEGPACSFQIDFCEDGWSECDDNFMYMAMRNDDDDSECEYFLTLEEAKSYLEGLYRKDMLRFLGYLA